MWVWLISFSYCRCNEEDIEKEVELLRGKLLSEGYKAFPGMGDSHHLAVEMEKRNESIRKAFGISKDYVCGSAFDIAQQAVRAAERKAKREEREAEKEQFKNETSIEAP